MSQKRRTKIVCTMGPVLFEHNLIEKLMLAGMDVARFNFSHSTHEEHLARFQEVCRIRDRLGLPVATMLDTRGPEIRTGDFENGKVLLETGQTFTLTTQELLGNQEICSITYKNLPKDLKPGDAVLIDDGLVGMRVDNITETDILCTVLNSGYVSNHKGINVPGVHLSMPFISERDRSDILFGIETGFDFIAASFVRTAADINYLRKFTQSLGWFDVRIIAKIENTDGVENIDEILEAADGIMVARGDMGVEIPFEQIPAIQKSLIKKGYNAGKQVITATQMLESMITNPRPTRAEITDVANALYDGTSAIMLSGETAAGAYPVEAVKTMALIAETTENNINYKARFASRSSDQNGSVAEAIAHATVTTAHDLNARAIITVSLGGQTARLISKYRPSCPIIGCTMSEVVCRQMNMSWGVIPFIIDEKTNTDDLFAAAVEAAESHRLVEDGDLVAITAGVPLGVSGTTNLMKVEKIGK